MPDFVNAAWSAAQNRPLRQQMLPLSATGGGRICCPSEGACIYPTFADFVNNQCEALHVIAAFALYFYSPCQNAPPPEANSASGGKCYANILRGDYGNLMLLINDNVKCVKILLRSITKALHRAFRNQKGSVRRELRCKSRCRRQGLRLTPCSRPPKFPSILRRPSRKSRKAQWIFR